MRLSGFFITFEGDDGVGKSTHVRRLAQSLIDAGYDVLCLREPGNTPIGEKLRAVLLDSANAEMTSETELLIYEAARAQMVRDVLMPALKAGKVVICDRFTDSTVAYQALGRGLDRGFVEAANDFATQGLKPDMTLLLELSDDSEKSKRIEERGSADRLELAGADFHARVSEAFSNMPERDLERIVRIATARDEDETAARVLAVVNERLERAQAQQDKAARG